MFTIMMYWSRDVVYYRAIVFTRRYYVTYKLICNGCMDFVKFEIVHDLIITIPMGSYM